MDRACFIERNRAALLRIVAALVYMTGLDEGGAETAPRRVWRRVIALLRPAESCVRRLIVIAARSIPVTICAPRASKPKYVPWWVVKKARKAAPDASTAAKSGPLVVSAVPRQPKEKTIDCRAFRQRFGLACWGPARPVSDTKDRIPAFPLFDPLKRFDFGASRTAHWLADGWPLPLPGDDELSAAPLCRRVVALKAALDDLDRHARRMARWQARCDLASQSTQEGFATAGASQRLAAYDGAGQRLAAYDGKSQRLAAYDRKNQRLSPLRPGYPPGRRRRAVREIDDILRDCHAMARQALLPDNTS